MYTLFDTNARSLREFFDSITEDDLMDRFDRSVFYRGREYYKDDVVEGESLSSDKTKMTFKVNGSELYRVTIEQNGGKILGSCSCRRNLIALLAEID